MSNEPTGTDELDALIARDREAMASELPADVLGAMFDDIASRTVDREPSWRDRLRELPTPVRMTLAVCSRSSVGRLFSAVAWLRASASL